jgi:hypothetical protein
MIPIEQNRYAIVLCYNSILMPLGLTEAFFRAKKQIVAALPFLVYCGFTTNDK